MKNALLAIFTLGAVGFVSAAPVPAGGYYPAPNYPYPPYPSYPQPGFPGLNPPYPYGTGGLPTPVAPGSRMCNCNNPTTKEKYVEPFCSQGNGQDQYRMNENIEAITQHVCIISKEHSDAYSNENCQKEFGAGFKGFCASYS